MKRLIIWWKNRVATQIRIEIETLHYTVVRLANTIQQIEFENGIQPTPSLNFRHDNNRRHGRMTAELHSALDRLDELNGRLAKVL